MQITVQWFNFDAIATQTCVAKVRLFRSTSISEDNLLSGGQVTMVLQDSNGYNSMSRNRARTDSGDNGYCMIAPCRSRRGSGSSDFRGFIVADYNHRGTLEELLPVSDTTNDGLNADVRSDLDYGIEGSKINVEFDERTVYQHGWIGPFHDYDNKWPYSHACSSAGYDDLHFRFHRDYTCYSSADTYDTRPTGVNEEIAENVLLWHDFFSYFPDITGSTDQPYRVCFVKVLAPRGTKLEAVSYVSHVDHPRYDSGDTRYGHRQDCANSGAVCLEARPPRADVATHFGSSITEDTTRISIKTVDRVIPVAEHAQSLSSERVHVISSIGDDAFQVFQVFSSRWIQCMTYSTIHQSLVHPYSYVTYIKFFSFQTVYLVVAYTNVWCLQVHLALQDNYSPNYGIYCAAGSSHDSTYNDALNMCRHGDGTTTPRDDTTANNWAVKFSCK